jgi:hypothetical protein
MISAQLRLQVEGSDPPWFITKHFQLSTLPPVGTFVKRTRGWGSLQVTQIEYNLDQDTFIVVCQGGHAEILGLYDEGGWEVKELFGSTFARELESYRCL